MPESTRCKVDVGAWRPLLEGADALRARALAGTAARAALAPQPLPATLYGGHAGLALLAAQLEREGLGEASATVAEVERMLGALNGVSTPVGLFGGLAGVGFALECSGVEVAEPLRAIEGAICEALAAPSFAQGFDLFDGVVGAALWLERRAAKGSLRARAALEDALRHLEQLAVETPDGLAWPLDPTTHDGSAGPFRLGAAHGNAAACALLAKLAATNDRARRLFDGSRRWVLAHCSRDGTPAPATGPELELTGRVAWCVGEPGVAVPLCLAGRWGQSAGLEEAGRALADAALGRPTAQWGMVDLAICHGVAGVAHTFNRLAQLTGEARYAEVARRGLGSLCAQLAGEPSDWNLWLTPNGYRRTGGLLEGFSGVALVLLAASSAVAPEWDAAFLLS